MKGNISNTIIDYEDDFYNNKIDVLVFNSLNNKGIINNKVDKIYRLFSYTINN